MIVRQILLALAVLAAPLPLNAQQPRKPITGEGTEGFRALVAGVSSKQLKPLETFDELAQAIKTDPQQVLIISFRGANRQGKAADDLLVGLDADINLRNGFVERGGALFVASDQLCAAGWIEKFHTAIHGSTIFAAGPADAFKNRSECPYVARWKEAIPNLFLAGDGTLHHVATNKPASLGESDEMETLAVFPDGTWSPVRSGDAEKGDMEFAQAKLYRNGGRFLLMADHSVFINSMLLPQSASNDNLQFASNCLDWLMFGPDTGRRSYVLFIEDGHIWKQEDYNLRLASLPPPRPEDIAGFLWENRDLLWENRDLAEGLLGQMEEDGIFAELEKGDPLGSLIRDLFDDWAIVRVVLILGTIALLGYGLWSFVGSKGRFPKKVPRLALLLDRMRPRTGLLDLRLRSGLGTGQYYELARKLARETFAELNLQPAEDGPPPRFTVEGSWWQRSRTARELRQVWAIAYGPEPVPVPGSQWAKWQQRLNRLALLIRGGAIRFE